MEIYEGNVVTIPNRHHVSCGAPPNITPQKGQVVWYMENEHGEQMLFQYLIKEKKALLYFGECNWQPFEITKDGPQGVCSLNEEEMGYVRLFCLSMKERYE